MARTTHIAITFSTTKFRELRATWRAFDAIKQQGNLQAFGTTRLDEEYCGGKVLILDWVTKEIERETTINRASGILPWEGGFLVGAYDRILWLDCDLNVRHCVDDHRFNNIHGLCHTPEGIAVASTGIDTILFLGGSLSVVGHWCATEHGFTRDPRGQIRLVDLGTDHRRLMYPTLLHTTHVNSLHWAEEAKDPSIYAVLFHQGTVQQITRANGFHKKVIDGLAAPHAVGRLDNGDWIVADSARSQAVVWRESELGLEMERVLFPRCDWVQDIKQKPLGEGYFVADCNGCRIVETDQFGNECDSWNYHADWKVHEMCVL